MVGRRFLGVEDLLSADDESVLLEELAASAVAEAVRYAADVDRLVRLERSAVRSGHTERGLEMELAGTLRIGQQAAAVRLSDARRLQDVLPLTLGCLRTGALLLAQARIVLEETRHCTEPVAAGAERRVLAGLDDRQLAGWTARLLRRRLRAAVLAVEAELEPEHAAERDRAARDSRRVSVRPEPDGMASLWALLPAEQLRAFTVGLDLLASRQREADRAAGMVRTADQRRADVLALLPALALHALDGTSPGAGAGHPSVVVHVHVPMATALGLSDEPGELDGHGPVSAGTVRLLLPCARLRRVLVDARTGEPLHADSRTTAPAGQDGLRPPGGDALVGRTTAPASRTTAPPSRTTPPSTQRAAGAGAPTTQAPGPAAPSVRGVSAATQRTLQQALLAMVDDGPFLLDEAPEPQYRPSRPLARLVQARYPQCTAPGCSRTTREADLDHRLPWPLGPTGSANLGPLSRRCHRAKTSSWSVRRDPDGGHTWTSPVGRTYVVPPLWRPPPEPRLPAPDRLPVRGATPPDSDDCGLTARLDVRVPGQPIVSSAPPGADVRPPF